MSSTLDQFFGTQPPKSEPAPDNVCSNPKCHKVIGPTDTKYTLTLKGKEAVFCRTCAKEKLKPLENREGSL